MCYCWMWDEPRCNCMENNVTPNKTSRSVAEDVWSVEEGGRGKGSRMHTLTHAQKTNERWMGWVGDGRMGER